MPPNTVPDDRRAQLDRVATDLTFCTARLDREAFRARDPDRTYHRELHDAEREVLAPLFEAGFEHVGSGIARSVLRFPPASPLSDRVVKLSRFGVDPVSLGAVQNKREAMLWARHGTSGDWPLVPVEDHDADRFSWLVMPYGDPVAALPEDERESHVERVRTKIRFLPAFDMRELTASNLVVVDGHALLADYGLPPGL